MKPFHQFSQKNMSFWSGIRLVSQEVGYTDRKTKMVKVPTKIEIISVLDRYVKNLDLYNKTDVLDDMISYFQKRSDVLNQLVKPRLMDKTRAEETFLTLKDELNPTCPLPMNKQKGDKKKYAYLTCIVNMIIENNKRHLECDFDPRKLVSITNNNEVVYTSSRRFDGCIPSTTNPICIWEIKEYYHTTTFGSRIADGVYETILDGYELKELKKEHNKKVLHYLMIDAHHTWWNMGKPYLCRIIDALNMGFLDEVLFGYEVIEQLPQIVKRWVNISNRNNV
jgi:hypothetical protein